MQTLVMFAYFLHDFLDVVVKDIPIITMLFISIILAVILQSHGLAIDRIGYGFFKAIGERVSLL